jgi:hypothetical protein
MARYDSGFRFDSGARFDEPDPTPTPIQPTPMIDLHKFLINPFDDPDISMAELLAFSTDHLQRLIANNPGGVYAARITATNMAVNAVGDAFTDDLTQLGIRKARKAAKDASRRSLPEGVARIYGAVTARFGPKGVEVLECFPQGRKVFSDCTDDQVAQQLQVTINGVTAYQAQLGAPVLADATALLTGWNVVYNPSETATGGKVTTQAAKSAAREGLQLELFRNLLTLALAHARHPEQLDLYMRQSLLEDHPIGEPEPPPTPPTP